MRDSVIVEQNILVLKIGAIVKQEIQVLEFGDKFRQEMVYRVQQDPCIQTINSVFLYFSCWFLKALLV